MTYTPAAGTRLALLVPGGGFTVVHAEQRDTFHAHGITLVLAELLASGDGLCTPTLVWVFESMTSGLLAFYHAQAGLTAEDNPVARRVIAELGGPDEARYGPVVFAAAQDGGVVGLSDDQLDDLHRARWLSDAGDTRGC